MKTLLIIFSRKSGRKIPKRIEKKRIENEKIVKYLINFEKGLKEYKHMFESC